MKTIGSFDEFKRLLPDEYKDAFSGRQAALEKYLSSGGFTKIEETGTWPKLVYPGPQRLEKQIAATEKKLEQLNKQIRAWEKRHQHLKTNKVTDLLARVSDPLYWEHHARMLADPSYRETYELVSPPMHLLHRKEWKKRLRMFVKSKEYRLRLHEARTSEIGKKREPMHVEVEKRMEFNRSLARTEKQKLLDKKKELQERLNAMRVLLSWAKE